MRLEQTILGVEGYAFASTSENFQVYMFCFRFSKNICSSRMAATCLQVVSYIFLHAYGGHLWRWFNLLVLAIETLERYCKRDTMQ